MCLSTTHVFALSLSIPSPIVLKFNETVYFYPFHGTVKNLMQPYFEPMKKFDNCCRCSVGKWVIPRSINGFIMIVLGVH